MSRRSSNGLEKLSESYLNNNNNFKLVLNNEIRFNITCVYR